MYIIEGKSTLTNTTAGKHLSQQSAGQDLIDGFPV